MEKLRRLTTLMSTVFSSDSLLHLIFSELARKDTLSEDHTWALAMSSKRLYAFGMPYYARAIHWQEDENWDTLSQVEQQTSISAALLERKPHLKSQVKLVSLDTSDGYLVKRVVTEFPGLTWLSLDLDEGCLDLSYIEPLRHLRRVRLNPSYDYGDPIGPNTHWCDTLFKYSEVRDLRLCSMRASDAIACLAASHGTLHSLHLDLHLSTHLTSTQWNDLLALTPALRKFQIDHVTLDLLRARFPPFLRRLDLGCLCPCKALVMLNVDTHADGKLEVSFLLPQQPLAGCVVSHRLVPPTPQSVRLKVEAILMLAGQPLPVWDDNAEPAPCGRLEGHSGGFVYLAEYYKMIYDHHGTGTSSVPDQA